MALPGDKTFRGEREVTYNLRTPASGPVAPYLAVVFSGMKQVPNYTYVKTLEDQRCHRLFLMDDYCPPLEGFEPNAPGCYYLGRNRDFDFERSVIATIDHVAGELGIARQNIISCGSSKGGWAALYYAFKYGFGHIVVGGPQTQLAVYLVGGKFTELARFIAGGVEAEDREYLDRLLFDVIAASPYRPDIHIHCGVGEPHFKKHVLPLVGLLKEQEIPFRLDRARYDTHAALSRHFPGYLSRTVQEIVESDWHESDFDDVQAAI